MCATKTRLNLETNLGNRILSLGATSQEVPGQDNDMIHNGLSKHCPNN
jgi:hypothetical protein